ncbi:MAG: PHP domain-containing protein, partial [bacterium]
MKDYPRGSEWRRWDLHVHTASSYDSKYNGNDSDDILTQAWKKMDFAAVAITDHFIIDKERINNLHKLIPNITIFPGVELRTDKGASNIHVILLFSEKKNLDALIEDFNSFKRNNAKNPEDNHKIYWDFEEILKFAKTQNALISLHAGSKTNGLDDMISNSVPVNEAIKEEFAKNVNFFEMGKIEDISNYKTHVFPTIGEKPLIICSDNHDPRNYSIKEYLWIKADPTFEGLIQCINQPEERTFVGDIPIKLDIANKNKQRYIESITVKKIEIPKNPSSNWFDFDIPINSGLTAIIGNKGSGKSALSDIIGHCCQSHAIAKHASFLHQDRFRKKKLADDYEGLIRWLDGEDDKKISLGELKYSSSIENAQYLPQKYIESVCNDLDNEFQDEINKVIFSYVDVTEKGTAKNLEELIESKSITLKTQIIDLQKKLSEINDEIITAEEKLVSSYEISLRENLIKRKDDLERHEKNKPSEIEKPEKSQSDDYV